jgi:hypothetical protein
MIFWNRWISINLMNNIEYALSTMAVEGLVPSQEAIDCAIKVEQGKMTLEQAVEAIKRMYRKDKKN